MKSKERMLCALNREKPDRLPVTIHQWQPYHLKTHMNNMSDIEANKFCGLDASITYFEVDEVKSADWKVSVEEIAASNGKNRRYTISTPEGTLNYSEGSNAMTTWITEHLIKNPEDIYLFKKYSTVPSLRRNEVVNVYDSLGDSGILRTFIYGKQGGCWQDACELFGVENLIMATYDDPQWVDEFLKILLEKKLEYIEKNLPGLPFDLIETGGGASSNTVISPSLHKQFCLPYDTIMHDAIKSLGFKTVYHTCGGMTKILDYILNNHCDASETLSPQSVGGDILTDEDALNVYEKLHPKLALIGGMDQINLLEKGSMEEIVNHVKKLFEIYGKDGGYILSASDHFFEAPVENLKIFAKAAHECVY